MTVRPACSPRRLPASYVRITWPSFSRCCPFHGLDQRGDHIVDRDGFLISGRQVLELDDILGKIAIAHDDGESRSRTVGGAHRALEALARVCGVRGEAR